VKASPAVKAQAKPAKKVAQQEESSEESEEYEEVAPKKIAKGKSPLQKAVTPKGKSPLAKPQAKPKKVQE